MYKFTNLCLLLPLVQSLLCEFFPSPELPETQTLENRHSLLQAFLFPHQRNLEGKTAVITVDSTKTYLTSFILFKCVPFIRSHIAYDQGRRI